MCRVGSFVAVAGVLGLGACAVAPPPGPSFAAMPGNGKTYEQFQVDDARCRQMGAQANGNVTPGQAAAQSGVGSAVAGTALGAAAGALLGAAGGAAGVGAAVGAGAGLLVGSAAGAGASQVSAAGMQRNYDVVYAQCMAAAGEKVPNVSASAAAYPGGYPGPAYPGYAYGYPGPYYGPAFYGPPVIVDYGWGWHRRYW